MREERQHMETRLDAQRRENEKLRQEVFELQLPKEAVSMEQVEALVARLQTLHSAQLLSDAEVFALEDTVADFAEARAALGVLTVDVVRSIDALSKVHKILAVCEAMPRDEMLARQLRRKFV